ncbi:hypothetical protein D3C84_824990 [compost metagenome]
MSMRSATTLRLALEVNRPRLSSVPLRTSSPLPALAIRPSFWVTLTALIFNACWVEISPWFVRLPDSLRVRSPSLSNSPALLRLTASRLRLLALAMRSPACRAMLCRPLISSAPLTCQRPIPSTFVMFQSPLPRPTKRPWALNRLAVFTLN